MNKEEISNRVRHQIARVLEIRDDEVTPESNVVDHLGADSLDRIDIVMAIEDEFEIEISDSECWNIKTVQQWIDVAADKVAAKNPA